MDRIYRVEVVPLPGQMRDDYLLSDIIALGIRGVKRVIRYDLFFLRGDLTTSEVNRLRDELLVDAVVQRAEWRAASEESPAPPGAVRVEVGLLPGVTDSVADNLCERARLLGMTGLRAAASAQDYLLFGESSSGEVHTIVRRLLCNDVIQHYELGCLSPQVGMEPVLTEMRADAVAITRLSDEELLRVSRERLLSLIWPRCMWCRGISAARAASRRTLS